MKTEIDGSGIFIDFKAKDIATIISRFEFESDDEFVAVFNAAIRDFALWDIGLRQVLVESLIKKHLCKKQCDEVIKLIESFDSGIWN